MECGIEINTTTVATELSFLLFSVYAQLILSCLAVSMYACKIHSCTRLFLMDPMYSAYNCGYLASPVFVFACVTLPLPQWLKITQKLSLETHNTHFLPSINQNVLPALFLASNF